MANLKQILHRLNESGTYDTIYLQADMSNVTGTLSVTHGGTGATTNASARSNLGITPANIGAAASSHNHAATDISTSAGYTVQAELNQVGVDIADLKSSVSNGKSLIASAITDKGVSTSSTATFQQMATNIGSIKTGSDPIGMIILLGSNILTNVYAVNNSVRFNGVYDNNHWYIPYSSSGTWTIYYTYSGSVKTSTVVTTSGVIYADFDISLLLTFTGDTRAHYTAYCIYNGTKYCYGDSYNDRIGVNSLTCKLGETVHFHCFAYAGGITISSITLNGTPVGEVTYVGTGTDFDYDFLVSSNATISWGYSSRSDNTSISITTT